MSMKTGSAVVIGGGISGMRSAMDLAEAGHKVYMVDKAPHIGGVLEQLDWQFPTNRCGMCRMLPSVDTDQAAQQCLRRGLFHENIEVMAGAEVTEVSGEAGGFQVRINQPPSLVDPGKCVRCGECEAVCPVEVNDDFNQGLCTRKAIYRPAPQALPGTYLIDLDSCTRCGECVSVCPTGAVIMSDSDIEGFKILAAEDQGEDEESFRAALAEKGFTTFAAGSGEDVLEKLRQESFHLLLLEAGLRSAGDTDLLAQALDIQPGLQVILLADQSMKDEAAASLEHGAAGFFIRPFNSNLHLPSIYRIYEEKRLGRQQLVEAGAVVVASGCSYFNPADEKDVFGYGTYKDVLTHLEFERLASGTGPSGGKLLRPSDGGPVRKIAWIQCVGSRDIQKNADFCSSICCMSALKEAMLARRMSGGAVETVIFYMDIRVFGKPYQKYLEDAEKSGVKLKRCRVHSVVNPEGREGLLLRYVDEEGVHEALFDLVVLSVGQRPSESAGRTSKMLGLDLNPWGFPAPGPFSAAETSVPGIFLAGSASGLADINDSVIRAGSAACCASRVINAKSEASEQEEAGEPEESGEPGREDPSIHVFVCTCGGRLGTMLDKERLFQSIRKDPSVCSVQEVDQLCTEEGWQQFAEELREHEGNRVLLAACRQNTFPGKPSQLAGPSGLPEKFVSARDIYLPEWFSRDPEDSTDLRAAAGYAVHRIKTAVAGLKRADLVSSGREDVRQSVLVVGGGIAGMTASLAIADHGFQVELVEKDSVLGGNLTWLSNTLDGRDLQALLDETVSKVDSNSLISVHLNSEIKDIKGSAGRFSGIVSDGESAAEVNCGAVILATGGVEADTESYCRGQSSAVMTQKEFEEARNQGAIDPDTLSSVAMIQCVDCREEPRDYCSRVCCLSALKNALYLKEQNPDIAVYILYRDIMAYGFYESYYTEARRKGVLFFPYSPEEKPEVNLSGEGESQVSVSAKDPVLNQRVEISADLLVLAAGVSPVLPEDFMGNLGAEADEHGFFREADFKWRPVDSTAAGVFACGLALSPRSVDESIATAEAAAMRAVSLISKKRVNTGRKVAVVRHSLCSGCRLCIAACPFDAREADPETGLIEVNAMKCQGCGTCAAVCPNSATVLSEGSETEMFEMIEAALDSFGS